MTNHLWLIGMMGSGKSAVGRLLAVRLGRTHYDTDAEVVSRTGCSIAQLWGEQGEAAFRSMESAAIDRLVDEDAAVISTGGGAVLAENNVAQMRKSGFVVWLQAPPEVLIGRVGDGTKRPLLEGIPTQTRLAAILHERAGEYAAAADGVVSTADVPPETVAERIEELWNAS